MTARLAVLIALLAFAGCGGEDEPTPAATTTPAPAETPAATATGADAYIGSIAVDPGDGTVMLGTGLGLFRVPKAGGKAEHVVGALRGPDGSGKVSSNLVVRYAGPGDLLASGHPEGAGALPENLGLIRSQDAGATWEPVSELGASDFHILQVAGDRVVAVHVEETEIQVSGDGGRTFEARTPPAQPLDVAFDPADPRRMVVATEQGTFSSQDGGGSWRPRDPVRTEQLAWGRSDALYRADAGGLIKVSPDGGATWRDAGSVGLPVNELAVDDDGALYASIAGGEVKRSTDGGKTWERWVKLGQ